MDILEDASGYFQYEITKKFSSSQMIWGCFYAKLYNIFSICQLFTMEI